MKSIASGVIANVASMLPAAALGLATQSLLTYIPGIDVIPDLTEL